MWSLTNNRQNRRFIAVTFMTKHTFTVRLITPPPNKNNSNPQKAVLSCPWNCYGEKGIIHQQK